MKLESNRSNIDGLNAPAELIEQTLAPFRRTVEMYGMAFPGVGEKIEGLIDVERIKTTFSAEVARSIKELGEENSRAALFEAYNKMRELAGLLSIRSAMTEPEARSLITSEGGIFIGKEELISLGKLSQTDYVPPIDLRFSEAFLRAAHPRREGSVASHIILAHDSIYHRWFAIDRGEGGPSDVVPLSLNEYRGRGLTGVEQDGQVERLAVEYNCLRSPHDSYPVERILNDVIKLHVLAGKPDENLPFAGVWGRTADLHRSMDDRRVLLGKSSRDGIRTEIFDGIVENPSGVGLMAIWVERESKH